MSSSGVTCLVPSGPLQLKLSASGAQHSPYRPQRPAKGHTFSPASLGQAGRPWPGAGPRAEPHQGWAGAEADQGPLPGPRLLPVPGQDSSPEVKALSLQPHPRCPPGSTPCAGHTSPARARRSSEVGPKPLQPAAAARGGPGRPCITQAGAEARPPKMTSAAFQRAWQPPAHTNERK